MNGKKQREGQLLYKQRSSFLSLVLSCSLGTPVAGVCSHAPAIAYMAQGHVDHTHNGLMNWNSPDVIPDSAPPWNGNWALTASSPAEYLQLHLFQDWFQGNGTLKPEGCNSRQIKLSITSHPLVGTSSSTPRTLLSPAMEKGHPHNSLMTRG